MTHLQRQISLNWNNNASTDKGKVVGVPGQIDNHDDKNVPDSKTLYESNRTSLLGSSGKLVGRE